MVNVTWYDAAAYANWLSAETNRTYRLPSEAEWEYAARAGGSSPQRQYGPQLLEWDAAQAADVESGEANAWGLHDMSGNVSEWVSDCAVMHAPAGQTWELPTPCSSRVRRGSSWVHPPPNPGAALRLAGAADLHSLDTGFRVVSEMD